MARTRATVLMFALMFALMAAVGLACAGRGEPAEDPGGRPAEPDTEPTLESERAPESGADPGRCYPYLPDPSGACRTHCEQIEHCAGSRGPGDFAENGWPLDCIGGECVPLPPDAVELD